MSDTHTNPFATAGSVTGSVTGSDDFDAAWREVFQRQSDMNEVITAVIRLTEGGARPVEIARLAAAVDRPVDQVRCLVDQADAGLPSLRAGYTENHVWLDFATTGTPRFWYQIGDRRIGVAGCGPDIFWTAQALEVPMRAEAICPVTGTTIRVDFAPDGVRGVQPIDAVVAAIHPGTVPEAAQLTDRVRVDADVCTQQTFFANGAAAQPWLERHPGGRVLPVTEFDRWFRHISATAEASASRSGSKTPPQSGEPCC